MLENCNARFTFLQIHESLKKGIWEEWSPSESFQHTVPQDWNIF